MLTKFHPYALFCFVCFTFSLGLLVYHHVPPELPEEAIGFTIYGRLQAVLNYDSPEFLNAANHPLELLEPKSIRQSRPGMIILVNGFNRLLAPIKDWIMPLFRASGKEIQRDEYIPYTIYILLNFLLLFLSFFTYWKILYREVDSNMLAVSCLGSLLVFNDVVKAFLWTPHTQLFNILVPLVCLYVFQKIKDDNLFNQNRIFLLAFLVGLGLTAYGTFLLFIPVVLIAFVWKSLRDKESTNLQLIVRLVLIMVLVLLPFLIWVFYVYFRIGSFYQYEYAQGQFAWLLLLLQSAPFEAGLQLIKNFSQMVVYAASQAFILPVIISAVMLATIDQDHRFIDRLKRMRKFPVGSLFISGLFLLFFAMSGLVAPRTAFSGVPSLIVGTAVVVCDILRDTTPFQRKLGNGLIILLVLLQGLFVLSKVGPFR